MERKHITETFKNNTRDIEGMTAEGIHKIGIKLIEEFSEEMSCSKFIIEEKAVYEVVNGYKFFFRNSDNKAQLVGKGLSERTLEDNLSRHMKRKFDKYNSTIHKIEKDMNRQRVVVGG